MNRAQYVELSVARTLAKIRQSRGISQVRAVELLRPHGIDIHSTSLSRIERGLIPLRVAELSALATVYRVSLATVLLSVEVGHIFPEDQT